MSIKKEERDFFEQIIIAKIWKDEDFKKEITSDPNAAIKKLLQERAPDMEVPTFSIKVIEETVDQLYMVVPYEIDEPKTQITDEDKKALGRKSLEHIIISRAAEDTALMAKLNENPKAVLESALQELDPNLNLPDNIAVKLLKETADEVYLVVPPDPSALADVELTEEQLEAVAGGFALVAVFVVGVVAVTAAAAVNVAGAATAVAAVNVTEAVNVHHVATAVKSADESPW